MSHRFLLHQKRSANGEPGQTDELELQLSSPDVAEQTAYILEGKICGGAAWDVLEGGSLVIHAPASHRADEVFFDAAGHFRQPLELLPDRDNPLALTVLDVGGQTVAAMFFSVWQGTRPAPSEAAPEPPLPVEEEPLELKPEWPDFARLVKDCLILAGEIADKTGRNRQELFEQIYSQERYAEEAFAEKNAKLYRECFSNLMKFAQYLEQLQQEHQALVQGSYHPPGRDEVLRAVRRLEREVIFLLARLRSSQAELRDRLNRLREALPALARRADRDVPGAVGDIQRLFKELDEIHTRHAGRASQPPAHPGPLAGPA